MNQIISVATLLIFVQLSGAQSMWTHFTADDFAKRRAKLMEKMDDGIAIFLAAELPEAYAKFRQDNNFYYLSGVEVPDAVMVLHAKEKEAYLFVPEDISNDIKKEAWIEPGEKLPGSINSHVLPRENI